jgi:putative redox protein
MSKIVISYEGNLRCRAEHPSSATVIITDAPTDHHGKGEGFSPSELLSVSLGSCILSIISIAAQAIHKDIAGATATVIKVMGNKPRRIANIDVEVRIPGSFDEGQRAKLEAAAHACPVHQVLGIETPITIHWDE